MSSIPSPSHDLDMRLWLPFDGPRCGLRGLMARLDAQGQLPVVLLMPQAPTREGIHTFLARTWTMGGRMAGLGHALWGAEDHVVHAVDHVGPANGDGYRAVSVRLDLARWCGQPGHDPHAELQTFWEHAFQAPWPAPATEVAWHPERIQGCAVLGPWRRAVERGLVRQGLAVHTVVGWSVEDLVGHPLW